MSCNNVHFYYNFRSFGHQLARRYKVKEGWNTLKVANYEYIGNEGNFNIDDLIAAIDFD